jgi:hypothetical protein
MSLKNLTKKSHENAQQELNKTAFYGYMLFGWACLASIIYTGVSIIKKIIRK